MSPGRGIETGRKKLAGGHRSPKNALEEGEDRPCWARRKITEGMVCISVRREHASVGEARGDVRNVVDAELRNHISLCALSDKNRKEKMTIEWSGPREREKGGKGGWH